MPIGDVTDAVLHGEISVRLEMFCTFTDKVIKGLMCKIWRAGDLVSWAKQRMN